MVYNLKIKKFANNKQQIILYGYPIHKNDKISQLLADKANITKSLTNHKHTDNEKLHSIYNSKSRTIKSIYDLARANDWDYFVTMTFNPEKVNRKNYDDIIHAMQLYIKTLKKHCNDFVYLIVPELHKDNRSWHLHGLFKNIDSRLLADSGKRTKDGDIIYNLLTWDYGWTTATKVNDNDRVVRYMTKYITKDLCVDTMYRNRFYCSRNINRHQENDLYYSIHEIDSLMDKIANNVLYAKSIEFGDSNVVYLEVENMDNYFDFRKEVNDYGNY